KNLAFNRSEIDAVAINNRGANSSGGALGSFAGGDTAWVVGLKLGHAALEKRWDWNVILNYRHIESDAVVDGFNDSEFGGGGTNLKGYSLGGTVALSKRVTLGLRWLSADSIDGPRFRNDIIQFDINGRF
ncbi:MAG: putative porin, partial [Verrucomicrobiota bacterium]